jgi:hypothetical protein
MKSYIKQLLRESLLAEKISNIDIDVNMLYDMYFKDDIDEIGRTGMVTDDMFKMKQTNTSILKDDESLLWFVKPTHLQWVGCKNLYYSTNIL